MFVLLSVAFLFCLKMIFFTGFSAEVTEDVIIYSVSRNPAGSRVLRNALFFAEVTYVFTYG